MVSQTKKTVEAVLKLIRLHAARSGAFGGVIAADTIAALARRVKAEIAINHAFADSLSDVLFPENVDDPVVVLQRKGEAELRKRLKRLSNSTLKRIATSSRLASTREIRKLSDFQLISLLVERAQREAGDLRGF
jgi:hypothetical protein